jgi:cell division protein FtsA
MNVVAMNTRPGSGRGSATQGRSVIAALDVGSSKICCVIAEAAPDRDGFGADAGGIQLRIRGIGHQLSHGIRNGVIIDLDAAEQAVRAAVDRAERAAGFTIDGVYVNVSGGRPACNNYAAAIRLREGRVAASDLECVVRLARADVVTDGRTLLHSAPVAYTLDSVRGIRQPEGMFAETLGVDLCAVTVDPGPMRNLASCIERCHLNVDGFVIAPYATGRSVLVADERDLGVTCIDMGGGTTSVGVFVEGNLVFADAVPIGGQHVTNDIARGLSTTVAHAERMKTLHGSALPSLCDDREVVPVPLVGERGRDTVSKVPKSMLTGIIQPRLEETFELIRDRLQEIGVTKLAGRRAVLTGGASQLHGARELASSILDLQVRAGYPRPLQGMPDKARGAPFAVAMGLLDHAIDPNVEIVTLPGDGSDVLHRGGYFSKVGRWIRDSF